MNQGKPQLIGKSQNKYLKNIQFEEDLIEDEEIKVSDDRSPKNKNNKLSSKKLGAKVDFSYMTKKNEAKNSRVNDKNEESEKSDSDDQHEHKGNRKNMSDL